LHSIAKLQIWQILCQCLLAYWLTTYCVLVQADDTETSGYQLGRGYAVADTGITLGGYASTHLQALGSSPWRWNVSSLSSFVTWDSGAKLRFFSETELENGLTADGSQNLTTGDAVLHLERLYLDYLISNQATIRIGKMLTPIGQWNLIHVDPLVWTTSRPVATTDLFSSYTNGAMLHGSVALGQRALEYAVYGDYGSVLDPSTSRFEGPVFDNAQGLRLRYDVLDTLKLGLSYSDFALSSSPNIRNHLLGMDFAWAYQRFAINSEVVLNMKNPTPHLSDEHDTLVDLDAYRKSTTLNAWQGYIQGVCPLINSFYAIGRYEFFDQNNWGLSSTNRQFGQAEVFGLAYRPIPPIVWKLEYRIGTNNAALAADGLQASFSVLF
jgi:hypothetical protein